MGREYGPPDPGCAFGKITRYSESSPWGHIPAHLEKIVNLDLSIDNKMIYIGLFAGQGRCRESPSLPWNLYIGGFDKRY